MEASAPISVLGGNQGRSSSDGDSGGWTTVRKKQRQRRKATAVQVGLLLAASEGKGSSAGSTTPAASEVLDLLSSSVPSSSLPSPHNPTSLPQPGLLAQAIERATSASTTPVANPQKAYALQQPATNGTLLAGSSSSNRASSAATAAMPASPHPAPLPRLAAVLALQESLPERQEGVLLPRQESLSHSALNLHERGKAPLRSSKSDITSLTISMARQHHEDDHSSSLGGIPESARGEGGTGGGSTAEGQARSAGGPQLGTGWRGTAAEQGQLFASYLAAELHPSPSYPTSDLVWGQSERDHVYNALVSVPYQLERLLLFGVAVCLDSFLAIFTLLPLRVGMALLALGRGLLSQARRGSHTGGAGDPDAADRATPNAAAATAAAVAGGGGAGGGQQQRVQLRGDQLFDLLSAAMSLGVVLFLWNLNAGTLYFCMKDLTQELLKLSVLYTALELSDKICCSFGVDVLEALAASCTQLSAGWGRHAAYNVACDVAVASLLLMLHGATLMSQAMVFGVAMNSKKNTLVALLIAANFTEIKGTVLKRFDATKLYTLACQDIVERFHLLLVLAFVVVEEMGNSGSHVPNPALLSGCARIYAGEVMIDVIKHAVLGKFNDIRPGVYREFMRDLCDRVSGAQSHNIHKLVGFEPFAPSALFFRIALTVAALCHDGGLATLRPLQVASAVPAALALWALLLLAKLGLGYLLKLVAAAYVVHYEVRQANGRSLPLRRAATGQQQAKKED